MADEQLNLIIAANVADLIEEMYQFVAAAKDAEDQIRRFEIAIKRIAKEGGLAFEQAAQQFIDYYDTILKKTEGRENIFSEKSLRNLNTAVNNLRKMQTSVLQLNPALREEARRFYDMAVAAGTSEKKVNLIAQAIRRISEVAGISLEAAKREFMSFARTIDREAASMGGKTLFGGESERIVTDAMRQLRDETENTGQSFLNLGSIGRYVFGGLLAGGIAGVLNQLREFAAEAAQVFDEFSQGMFTLAAGIRAMQRAGEGVSLQEFLDTIDKLRAKYKVFSEVELVEGISRIVILTRNFGFTAEQMKSLMNITAALSVLMGKDMTTAISAISQLITTGYARAIRNLSVEINRVMILQEAQRQGAEAATFAQLTEAQRAAAIMAILERQIGDLEADAQKFADSTVGATRSAKSAWKDFKETFGGVLAPMRIAWGKFASWMLERWIATIDAFKNAVAIGVYYYVKNVSYLAIFFGEVMKKIRGESSKTFAEIANDASLASREVAQSTMKNTLDLMAQGFRDLGNAAKDGRKQAEEEQQNLLDVLRKIVDKIQDVRGKFAEKSAQLWARLVRDLEKVLRRYQQRVEDENLRHQQRMVDIDLRAQQQREDALARFALRKEQLLRQFDKRRRDAERKYRENELKAEREFQLRMMELRENFLMNLEDAVRERDARQVLRLTRQYNLQKEQLRRRYEAERQNRREAFQRELQDIAEQRAERLRQLQEELDMRLRMIEKNRQREQQKELENHQRRLEKLREQALREQAERNALYQQHLADLQQQYENELRDFVQTLDTQYKFSKDSAQKIYEVLKAYYGAGGYIDAIYKGLLERTQQATASIMAQISTMLSLLLGLSNITTPTVRYTGNTTPSPSYTPTRGYAEGGTLIAKRPTLALFGERPEVVTFAPLTKVGANIGNVYGSAPPAPLANGMAGRMRIDVYLSPDLEARVVEKSLDSLADVVIEQVRAR